MIGFGVGLTAGILHLEGMFVIITFFALLFLLSNIHQSKILNVNEDDFPNQELTTEGLGNSIGIFLVSDRVHQGMSMSKEFLKILTFLSFLSIVDMDRDLLIHVIK